jgi:hypothetical protein
MEAQQKQCSKCGIIKPVASFNKRQDSIDGLCQECKACTAKRTARWKKNNPDKVKKEKQKYYSIHRKKISEKSRRWYEANKNNVLTKLEEKRTGKAGYLNTMLKSAKARAKSGNLAFDIDLDYLLSIATDHCPIDNLPFDWNRQLKQNKDLPLSVPSLDRIDSNQGYIRGNVKIIGWKWNTKKSNMSLDDLMLLVEYVRNATKSNNFDHF